MTYKVFNSVFRSIPIFFHFIAFNILYRTKYSSSFNRVQRFYLLNLSLLEMGICSSSLIEGNLKHDSIEKFYISVFQKCSIVVVFFFTYVLLTFDRFLLVHLNLRYPIVVTMQRVYRMYIFLYSSSFASAIVTCMVHPHDNNQLSHNATIYLWIPGDLIIIVVSVATYLYIFLRKNYFNKTIGGKRKSRQCSSMAPSTLLVLSFVLAYAIPDLTYAYYHLFKGTISDPIHCIFSGIFSFAYSIDAFIYIFSLKSVRLMFGRQENPVIAVIQKSQQSNVRDLSAKYEKKRGNELHTI